MRFITGYLCEDSKVVAYALYDTDRKKAMLLSKEQVKNMVMQGIEVLGFECVCTPSSSKPFVRKSKNFLWKELPELNGKGEPLNEKKELVIGTNGFKEMKSFVTVNSIGEIRIYSKDEMEEKLTKDNSIIGAVIASDGRIMPYVAYSITDGWLNDCGWEKDEDWHWKKVTIDK